MFQTGFFVCILLSVQFSLLFTLVGFSQPNLSEANYKNITNTGYQSVDRSALTHKHQRYRIVWCV